MNKSLQTAIVLIAFVISFPFLLSILPHIGPAVTRETPTGGWNKFFEEWLRAIGPLGSVIIGWMMWRIAKNQHYLSKEQFKITLSQQEIQSAQLNLAKSQLEISYQQAETSREQKEIAKTKIKMELFDKRYACYSDIKDVFYDMYWSCISDSYKELDKKHDQFHSKMSEFRFIFSYNVYSMLFDIWDKFREILNFKLEQETKKISLDDYFEKINLPRDMAANIMENKLFNEIYPHLNAENFIT